ncbi:peptidylprolyl isomerase [Ectothiorhodospiraceae bacterium 2226]|nr:peptidylprolyl isomerase [Ectothiorhodospiraceae bacterium 2226]
MKHLFRSLTAALLIAVAAPHPGALSAAHAETIDRIVAVVESDVILQSELEFRVREIVDQLHAQGTAPPPQEVLARQMLERLVVERLQLREAEDSGIRVDDQTLNEVVGNIARQNNLSLTEFRRALEMDGISFAQFREQIREEITINRLRQRQVNNRVEVNEQEIAHYLETLETQRGPNVEYRLGHLLVSIPEGAGPDQIAEARERAEAVLAKLRAGADFHQTVMAESDGQQALEGGDLGWRSPAQVPTVFADAVPRLRQGELSDIIRSPSGFHVVKLLDVRDTDQHVVTRTRARHILIRPSALVTDAEARTRLADLRDRIAQGTSFADMARAHSDDTTTAREGGELGWVTSGQTVPEFEEQMNALEAGDVSEPFRSPFGWHIVQVLERAEHDDTREVRRMQAREAIRARKTEEELQAWLRRLRDEAYVEYRL